MFRYLMIIGVLLIAGEKSHAGVAYGNLDLTAGVSVSLDSPFDGDHESPKCQQLCDHFSIASDAVGGCKSPVAIMTGSEAETSVAVDRITSIIQRENPRYTCLELLRPV